MEQFIIGLSGHIDHGKTSLVQSLTGKNTDNLKEEIKRGMTINIGFAFLDQKITLIDVPGHEKFIKNMVAGVNSIDYALLIIAADDGIMPQTKEHFEILKLLNIKYGSIVINKIDMVDNDWIELVEIDIQEMVKNSFLENCTIHKVSAQTGENIEKLKEYLISYNIEKNIRFDRGIFSMYVDRIFSSKGFGQVVTGTIASGKINVGDSLKLLPLNKEVKVRGLQTHNESVSNLSIGNRAAINIQSNDKFLIKRGFHLSSIDYINIYLYAIVKVSLLEKHTKGLKNNERIRIYIGTQEVMARILFPKIKILSGGQQSGALLKFEKPLVASIFDYFIIRTYSPLKTIGGGNILDLGEMKKWKVASNYINKLIMTTNKYELVEEIISFRGNLPFTKESLKKHLSISSDLLLEILNKIDNKVYIENKWVLTVNQLTILKKYIIDFLNNFHNKNSNRFGILKKEIAHLLKIDENLLDNLLDLLLKENLVKVSKDLWSLETFKILLSKEEIFISDKLLHIINDEQFKTSSLEELIIMFKCNEKKLKQIINMGINDNKLIMLSGNLLFSTQNLNELVEKIYVYFKSNDSLDIKNFKILSKTTRKYAVPLLEYLDKLRITYREGNERKINK